MNIVCKVICDSTEHVFTTNANLSYVKSTPFKNTQLKLREFLEPHSHSFYFTAQLASRFSKISYPTGFLLETLFRNILVSFFRITSYRHCSIYTWSEKNPCIEYRTINEFACPKSYSVNSLEQVSAANSALVENFHLHCGFLISW